MLMPYIEGVPPWIADAAALKSQSKNTPFLGHELVGKVRYTIVGGDVVFEKQM